MKTHLLPGRTSYYCSGRVNWSRFLPWTLLLAAASAGIAALLMLLFVAGHYYILLVPALAALAIAGLTGLAIGQGHCRSVWVGSATGFLAGALMYFGHYYAEMVHDFGPKAAGHVEWLPKYIRFRMATQVIRDTYDSRDNDSRARRHAGGSVFNWLFLGAETVIVLGLTTTWGYRRSRKGYCETCQRWMTRELTEFEPDKAPQLVEALQTGSARSLAALCAAPAFSTLPNTTVALEVCPSLKEGTARDCPVFLSIKSVAANRGGATLDRFESSKGKVLVRGVTLTPAECRLLPQGFPSSEPMLAEAPSPPSCPRPSRRSRSRSEPAASPRSGPWSRTMQGEF